MGCQDKIDYCHRCHKPKRCLIDKYEYDSSNPETYVLDEFIPTSHSGGCYPGKLFAIYTQSIDGAVEISDLYNGVPKMEGQECPFSTRFSRRWLIYDKEGNQIAFNGSNQVDENGVSAPELVEYFVIGTLGKKWKGAKIVTIDFRNPIRIIKIYK